MEPEVIVNIMDQVRTVSPALARYSTSIVVNDVWQRPGLSARDRSLVTVASLIGRNQSNLLRHYVLKALEAGVTAAELSETLTHLAFYSGWANAFSAVTIVAQIFQERGISADVLPSASPELLPVDQIAEVQRSEAVGRNFGEVSAGLLEYTTDVLFQHLWLRPALPPRDRSLVTVSALIANGQSAQVTFHLNRAMDKGLTKAETSEVLIQLAFYAGWPNVFSALPVVKDVFKSREL